LALGKTVEELGQMSSNEFTYWLAYNELEPFGAERDNYHVAMLASIYINSRRSKGSTKVSPKDFMYKDIETARELKTNSFVGSIQAAAKK